jgi:hypothetical protein
MSDSAVVRDFFVDEAGDLTLYDRRGKCIVGTPGVSKLFMVGLLRMSDPQGAAKRLSELRRGLLNDPYFRGVPSMQPDAGKTAVQFHAKDDPAEVRREVFRVIATFRAKVIVAVRRKVELLAVAERLHRFGMKWNQNDVYDDLVKRIFKNELHKGDENRIVFARRGKSHRQSALTAAIDRAKSNFERTYGIDSRRPVRLKSDVPSNSPGLQVVDYYLWALQRLYERGEDRFFRLLSDDYRLIMDLDDKRNKMYGEWYTDTNPLEAQKIKPVEG